VVRIRDRTLKRIRSENAGRAEIVDRARIADRVEIDERAPRNPTRASRLCLGRRLGDFRNWAASFFRFGLFPARIS
jgi:hypothetical protein